MPGKSSNPGERGTGDVYARLHALLGTVRGMLTDEEPHHFIDTKVALADDLAYELRERAERAERERDALASRLRGTEQAGRELLHTAEGLLSDRERAMESDRHRIRADDANAAVAEHERVRREVGAENARLRAGLQALRSAVGHAIAVLDSTGEPPERRARRAAEVLANARDVTHGLRALASRLSGEDQ